MYKFADFTVQVTNYSLQINTVFVVDGYVRIRRLRLHERWVLVAEEQLSAQPIQVTRGHLYRSKAKAYLPTAVNNRLPHINRVSCVKILGVVIHIQQLIRLWSCQQHHNLKRTGRKPITRAGNPWAYLEVKMSKVKVTRPINAVTDNAAPDVRGNSRDAKVEVMWKHILLNRSGYNNFLKIALF